jgi:hypothetical protein
MRLQVLRKLILVVLVLVVTFVGVLILVVVLCFLVVLTELVQPTLTSSEAKAKTIVFAAVDLHHHHQKVIFVVWFLLISFRLIEKFIMGEATFVTVIIRPEEQQLLFLCQKVALHHLHHHQIVPFWH